MYGDERDDCLIVLIEVVAGRTRRAAGEEQGRLPAVSCAGELPDALVVGLELLEAR